MKYAVVLLLLLLPGCGTFFGTYENTTFEVGVKTGYPFPPLFAGFSWTTSGKVKDETPLLDLDTRAEFASWLRNRSSSTESGRRSGVDEGQVGQSGLGDSDGQQQD